MNCQLQAEASLILGVGNHEMRQWNYQEGVGGAGNEESWDTESEDDRAPNAGPPRVGGQSPAITLEAQRDSRWKNIWRSLIKFFKDLRIRGRTEDLDHFQLKVQQTGYITRFAQLFRKKRIRRATVAATVVMISQQLCGVGTTLPFDILFRGLTATNLSR
jgi:hypothetical protein